MCAHRNDADLLVIGAGPAGLRLARRFAEAGWHSVVLDERTQIGRGKICSGIIGCEAFERLELPQARTLNTIQDLTLCSHSGQEIEYRHPEPLAEVVDRVEFDAELGREAVTAGAIVESGVRAGELRQDNGGVEVLAEVEDDDEPVRYRAPLVAVATGVYGPLAKSAGLGLPKAYFSAAQATVSAPALERTRCYLGPELAPGGFGWLVPLGNGQAKLGLVTESSVRSGFQQLARHVSPWIADTASVTPQSKPIIQQLSGESFNGRVFAVGESAGQVKTTTGGGIYYGMLGAELAAQELGRRHPRVAWEGLGAYEDAWKLLLGPEIESGWRFRRAAARLSDQQVDGLFSLAQVNGLLSKLRRKVRFDWHEPALRALTGYAAVRSLFDGVADAVADTPGGG